MFFVLLFFLFLLLSLLVLSIVSNTTITIRCTISSMIVSVACYNGFGIIGVFVGTIAVLLPCCLLLMITINSRSSGSSSSSSSSRSSSSSSSSSRSSSSSHLISISWILFDYFYYWCS